MMEFLDKVKKVMEEQFGDITENEGCLRVIAKNMGTFNSNAIVEISWMQFREGAEHAHPVLQFYSTLARDIEDEEIPSMKAGLWELNRYTMLGNYGYYEPFRQIYHCYRMPVNLGQQEAALEEIRYYLEQLKRQLNTFLDYVLILAENSKPMSIVDYIIGTNAGAVMEELIQGMDEIKKDMEK